MNDDQHTYKKLMKRRFSQWSAIVLVVTILIVALGAGVIYAGLATREVGKLAVESTFRKSAVRKGASWRLSQLSEKARSGRGQVGG